MRVGIYRAIVVAIGFLVFGAIARADTYSDFHTRLYYSANHRYFVRITPNKHATLYRKDRRPTRVWSTVVPELPASVFVANDGSRVVLIDNYYGNGSAPFAKVVMFFNQNGQQIASHSLIDLVNLSRTVSTTSSAHWYYGALFTPDRSTLVVETIVRKCEPPAWIVHTQEEREELEKCSKAVPYEALSFSMATGELVSRADIQSRYIEPEKRLMHELEFLENEHPPDKLSMVYALLHLAHFYERMEQYRLAAAYYERAIPIYSASLGAAFYSVVEAVGQAATNYRKMGDYRRAERSYRRALTALDSRQGDPRKVSPIAITMYEQYSVLLRQLKRDLQAERMERRAKVLRVTYPDYEASSLDEEK
jgi:tetratricopeptide (TPR) repeat protein